MSKVAAGSGLASAAATPATASASAMAVDPSQPEEDSYPISDRDESSDDDYEDDDRAKDDKVPEWAKGETLRKVTCTQLLIPFYRPRRPPAYRAGWFGVWQAIHRQFHGDKRLDPDTIFADVSPPPSLCNSFQSAEAD